MSEFSYDRRDIVYTLPFNPTEEGYEYKHCNCRSVKFEKQTENGKISLGVIPDKKTLEVNIFEKKNNIVHHKGTRQIDKYASNQEGFKLILQEEGL